MNTNVNSTSDPRSTRIAVFIDFDNVEIGVKSTIGGQFDIGLVLEAIKERGEIVTKIAYSDWQRAGDYSRLLTQHAIRMVQRNLTPGGDKNGADITMALDALEMAFTHDHINAFVIVGGDSDFISLVEKLKQYGRKVIVVGGRQFTSQTMQRNCHEFIAYENLVGGRGGRGGADRSRPASAGSDMSKVLPLVRRALKVLSEREVAPQLGLLKSTLLQLDSTFSEREYGASSFRDFMEKVARTGAVTLKHAGRSMLVESAEDGGEEPAAVVVERPAAPMASATVDAAPAAQPVAPVAAVPVEDADEEEALPASPMSMQDGIRDVQQAFAQGNPRWPMYVRQAKQYLRTAIDGFDERKYGFASVVDLLRAAGKEGVLRVERDRQGAVRVFPGAKLPSKPAPSMDGLPVEDPAEEFERANNALAASFAAEVVSEAPIVEADIDGEVSDAPAAFDVVLEDVTASSDTQTEAAVPSDGPGEDDAPSVRAAEDGAAPKKSVKRRSGAATRAPRTAKPKAVKAAKPRAAKKATK